MEGLHIKNKLPNIDKKITSGLLQSNYLINKEKHSLVQEAEAHGSGANVKWATCLQAQEMCVL